MFYKREPLETHPSGGFVYALGFPGSNFISIGLGHESVNGLNLAHVPTVQFHHSWAHEAIIECANTGQTALKTGKLAAYFDDAELFQLPPAAVERLIQMVKEVRDEGWGHPMDWEPLFVELRDGRFLWLAYGADIDKIRIGIGYYDAENERVIGDHSYAVGPNNAAEYAVDTFRSPAMVLFFNRPVGWPVEFDPYIEGAEAKQAMAVMFVRLADIVWRDIQLPRPQSSKAKP